MNTGVRLAVAAAAALALVAPAQASAVIAETDQTATSFDGTEIRYHLFLPDGTSPENRVPIVMQTHGWGGTGSTGIDDENLFIKAGYGVMTWDQRGFGASGGKVAIDHPDIEGRDVQALIDLLEADPRVAKRRGDPRIGMSGGSYAGGIQFVTAAIDDRVDAIVPEIAWNNLYDTLAPEGIIKLQWSLLLYGAGTAAAYSAADGYEFGIHRAFAESAANGAWSHATREFFESRGPWNLLDRIEAPTFIIQATTDTLFPPSQAAANFATLKAEGNAPLKMAWYCGGHGVCDPFSGGADGYVDDLIVRWFDRWVKRRRSVRTGPKFEYLDQQGDWNTARSYPVRSAQTVTSEPASGVVATPGEPTAGGVIGLSATEGQTSLEVPLPSFTGHLIGQPVVNMRVTVVGSGTTDRPLSAPLYFQLVDKGTGAVLGNQTIPKLFTTDTETQELSFPIEGVSYDVAESDQLVLEINSNSSNYLVQRGAGVFNIEEVTVDLPVVQPRAKASSRRGRAAR
ncbi:MAG TPA: CocE/NonD family hydrolase [Thermoleophilaceae bacterium]|nr:CocE/NonD family hydrolase [Thermoleophilaceae bacterium]